MLRTSSMSTYENRRISTGVLLFGSMPEPCHAPPETPANALPYSHQLTTIRSFHRLCDGLRTMALVDQNGLLAELIDVHEWAEPYRDMPLAVPPSATYVDHAVRRCAVVMSVWFFRPTARSRFITTAYPSSALSMASGGWWTRVIATACGRTPLAMRNWPSACFRSR